MSTLNSLYDSILNSTDPVKRLQLVELLQDWIRRVDLFSDNESLNEISTKDLKFLQVPALKASILSELSFENVTERLDTLLKSKELLLEFLKTTENLGLVSTKYPTKREELILEYKRQKELEANIKLLESRDDEEGMRDLFLKDLELQIIKSKQLLKSNTQELELLENHSDISLRLEKYGDSRLDMKNDGALLSREGKVLRPFIIRSNRQELKSNVFKPGHNLPSMTIDEYLEKEFERGNVLKGGTDSDLKELEQDLNEEEEEKKLFKDRNWDEFKEDNPKGWGNRMNKS